MKREVWLNRIVIAAAFIFIALWTWWLFKPTPMPFTLRARWNLQNIPISDIAFSPKGNLLAFSTLTPKFELVVALWKLPEGKEVKPNIVVSRQVQPLLGIPLRQMAFSPNGRLLAVGYQEQGLSKVGIFSIANGQRVQTITMGKSKAQLTPSVIFSPDGNRLAVGYDLKLWFVRVKDWKPAKSKIFPPDIAFSPNGRFIAAAYAIMPILIYDSDERLIRQLVGQPKLRDAFVNLSTIAFSKDGQRIACIWSEERIRSKRELREWVSVWRVKDGRLERSLPLGSFHEDFLPSALALDESLVALAEMDETGMDWLLWQVKRLVNNFLKRPKPEPPIQVVMRRISDGQLIAKLPRLGYRVTNLAFSPDGRYLVVVYDHIKIALWERKERQ